MQSERAVERLRALAETWVAADVLEAKAELLHAIYEKIDVAGRTFVGARLTPAAYANGLALVLPEQVVMVRPTRFRPIRGSGRGDRRPNGEQAALGSRRDEAKGYPEDLTPGSSLVDRLEWSTRSA